MTICVYITTYNRLPLLKRAIDSVFNQQLKADELIVIDDGSSDGTVEYLQKLNDEGKLTFVANDPPNQGACIGRNRAINATNCTYITGLDDDDYFEPWRLKNFSDYAKRLDEPHISALFDSVVEHRHYAVVKCFETPAVTYPMLRQGNCVGNQVFTKTEYLRSIDGFDPAMPALQDWDTWLRLSNTHGQVININSYSYIQIHDHGGVRISAKKQSTIRKAFSILQEKLSPINKAEEIHLMYAMYSYQQVMPRAQELLLLAKGAKFRRIAQSLKRKIKSII